MSALFPQKEQIRSNLLEPLLNRPMFLPYQDLVHHAIRDSVFGGHEKIPLHVKSDLLGGLTAMSSEIVYRKFF
jgi:hypothetical protein